MDRVTYRPKAIRISQVLDAIICGPDKVIAAIITDSETTVYLARGSQFGLALRTFLRFEERSGGNRERCLAHAEEKAFTHFFSFPRSKYLPAKERYITSIRNML